jgi:hypothetical protein
MPAGPRLKRTTTFDTPPFDGPVILFHQVVEVTPDPMPAGLRPKRPPLSTAPPRAGRRRDHRYGSPEAWDDFVGPRLWPETVWPPRHPVWPTAEIEGGARRVDRPVKVPPLALHADVRLIDAPRIVGGLEPFAQAPFQCRGVALHPPPNRDVIGVQAPFGQEFLHVSVRERKAQVPADGQEDYLGFKLAPLEQASN